MSRSELENLQSERLKKVVKNVYDNVKPYREKMDEKKLKPADIHTVRDLSLLPFTVKHDLRNNYPFGMFAAPKKEIVRLHASSGTTGKLTVVGYTKNDLDVWAECTARALVMAGAHEESVVQVSYGYGLFTGGLGLHYGVEKLGAVAVPTSSGNTKRQIMLMKDFGANFLCCTPSYAVYIAEEMQKEGISPSELQLQGGIFGAEPWTEEMRREIEKRLHIRAYDIYGLSEIMGPGVAMQCSENAHSHIFEDHFIPEVVDPDTLEPLPYGTRGELVFTTITKEGIPLIRYRTRDITTLRNDKCACGRTFVTMDRVTGRSDDMLIIRGVNVFPSQIESVLIKNSGGRGLQYQIIVTREGMLDNMEIQIEMDDALFSDQIRRIEDVKNAIQQDLNSMLSISAKVTLVEVNSLPRSEGKAKRVIDMRDFS